MSHLNVYDNHDNSPIFQWLPPWDTIFHNDIQGSGISNDDPTHCDWSGI